MAARYGREERFDILLQIDALRQEIVALEQTVRATSTNPASGGKPRVFWAMLGRLRPAERKGLIQQTAKNLIILQQALALVASELIYLPETVQAAARRLVGEAQNDYVRMTKASERLHGDLAAPEQALRELLDEIWQTQAKIHPLELRQIHRQRYNLLEQQRAVYQVMLPTGDLRQSIDRSMAEEQHAIAALEQKALMTPHDVEMLTIHRQNLAWYQEIVTGQRPYSPVRLLWQIRFEETDIKEIDDYFMKGE